MKKGWAVLGLGLGAGLIYIGKEAWGIWAEAQDALDGDDGDGEGPIEDAVVGDRVRGRLARSVTRPEAVEVAVRNGVVTLTGTVPAVEFDRLVSTVLRVRGVRDIDDQLDVRPVAD